MADILKILTGMEIIMLGKLVQFFKNDEAATAIEYSLIAALLAIAAIASMQAVATSVSTNFSDIASGVDAAV